MTHSRQDIIALLERLAAELRENPEQCENQDTATYLSAMAGWLGDCSGCYANAGRSVDVDQASWDLFADALQAALIYE